MSAFVAKLFVSSVRRQASAPDAVEVSFGAVTRGEANRAWAEATPAASFAMTVQNPAIVPDLRLGREFYVHFEPAEAVASLADGHGYALSDYEVGHPTPSSGGQFYRCSVCNCKRPSHDEPLRSELVRTANL